MSRKDKKIPENQEIVLGRATYTVERVFSGEKTVSELIANKIVNDKELLPTPTEYDNVG